MSEVEYGTISGLGEEPNKPLSTVHIQVSAVDMVVHWRRCSLTADFLAGFLAPSFESEDAARSRLSMILDELIENAVKFSSDVSKPVSVVVENYGDRVRVEASNLCDAKRARDLESAILLVLQSDIETLFLEQIERSAAEDRDSSRLGFITLRMNHGAELGARIAEARPDGLYNVTVQVLLRTREKEA